MCGDCNDPFHGLEDDIDDAFDASPLSQDDIAHGKAFATAEAARATFSEKCPSCRGSGQWRPGYPCFKCKGKGKLTFKTSPAQRAAGAQQRANVQAQTRITLQAQRDAWIAANPEDFAWMNAKQETFEFALSMYDAFIKWGGLTEKQHATVTRLRIADEARAQARKVEAAARVANAPVVNIERIERAFATAQAKGVKKPKMRLGEYKFSLAPLSGRNAGAVYVTRPSDDQYLGKIQNGTFTRVRECSVEAEAEIVALASDPHASSIAYGQRTGNCGICGRELTNHASIDLGIGPICAEKYGWA